ncbi:MAG: DUF192 domain-containing protein [Planctomycetota bacterium]
MADRRMLNGWFPAGFGAGLVVAVASLAGCDEDTARTVSTVDINGETFYLELAADPDTRFLGLGGRDFIAPDGGMLFAFPRPQQMQFVMRDCLVDIDIVFLDATGRVTAMHHMPKEPLMEERREGESDAEYNARRQTYELSLKRYTSRSAAQFVLEFAGGTLERLDLQPGEKVELDTQALIRQAR